MPQRRAVKEPIKREVLTEAGYRCAVPTCRTILAIDLHHLDHVAAGGSNTAANLIALCPTCHRLHHLGEIPHEALMVYKGLLVSLNEGIGREAKELLLLLAMDDKDRPQWYTSDGVLKFAPLIVAGLVQVHAGPPVADAFNRPSPWPGGYFVQLTERGVAVVHAWKEGNPDALRMAQAIALHPGPQPAA